MSAAGEYDQDQPECGDHFAQPLIGAGTRLSGDRIRRHCEHESSKRNTRQCADGLAHRIPDELAQSEVAAAELHQGHERVQMRAGNRLQAAYERIQGSRCRKRVRQQDDRRLIGRQPLCLNA